jgi:predicted lipid carrier protein YhbT
VATVQECREALDMLAKRLAANAGDAGKRLNLDRTLACRITDLGTAFHARLAGGQLLDIEEGDDPRAKIALTTTSDDLIALVRGQLDFARAMGSRRLSISASPFDLLKLRKLL